MFAGFEVQTRKILTGNILMILCCIFYLAWWLVAFKPTGAIKGMKSGWPQSSVWSVTCCTIIWTR